jgi:hypothetical protein
MKAYLVWRSAEVVKDRDGADPPERFLGVVPYT